MSFSEEHDTRTPLSKRIVGMLIVAVLATGGLAGYTFYENSQLKSRISVLERHAPSNNSSSGTSGDSTGLQQQIQKAQSDIAHLRDLLSTGLATASGERVSCADAYGVC
jgi:hypothetical protein